MFKTDLSTIGENMYGTDNLFGQYLQNKMSKTDLSTIGEHIYRTDKQSCQLMMLINI